MGHVRGRDGRRVRPIRRASLQRRHPPSRSGRRIVIAHEREADKRRRIASAASGLIGAVLLGGAVTLLTTGFVVPLAAAAVGFLAAAVLRARQWTHGEMLPDLVASDASARVAAEYVDDFDPAEVSDPFG